MDVAKVKSYVVVRLPIPLINNEVIILKLSKDAQDKMKEIQALEAKYHPMAFLLLLVMKQTIAA